MWKLKSTGELFENRKAAKRALGRCAVDRILKECGFEFIHEDQE